MLRKRVSVVVCIVLMLGVVLTQIPSPVIAVAKYEKLLGSDFDTTLFSYYGNEVSSGFGTAISIMAPVEPGTGGQFTKVAFAVELCEPFQSAVWIPMCGFWVWCDCYPTVEEMWVKVEGNSYYWPSENKIVDNTGTGGECCWDWLMLFGDVLMTVLPGVLFELYESPPQREWQDVGDHAVKAIVREKAMDDPPLQSAAANFYSYFAIEGYNTLTITAGASVSIRCFGYWNNVPVGTMLEIGEYPLDFQVSVPVTNEPETPHKPWGTTSGYVGASYTFYSYAIDPEDDNIRYKFDWGDGSTPTTTGWYTSGFTASASHTWGSSGTYYVSVRAQDVYEEWSNWSPILAVAITTSGGGGGGECPYVSVWDGSNYVLDNSILPTSQLSNGADVEDYYRLESALVRRNGKYSLLISEFEKEHSYIDQVKLLAVDHESDVNIAVASDGEFLTYKDPVAPLSAVDVGGTDRLDQIRYMDGNLSDPTTFFQGTEDDYLLLNFGQVNSEDAKLIVRNDMYCCVKCINVQVMDSNGEWQTVAVIASRTYWAVEGVDLSPYVVEGRDLLVRLGWTMPHKLDYVGLDTTKQDDCELCEANLVSATHSTQGDVKALLLEGDDTHAEIVPGQQIELKFTLPDNSKQARTYIFYTKGHWYTIQT